MYILSVLEKILSCFLIRLLQEQMCYWTLGIHIYAAMGCCAPANGICSTVIISPLRWTSCRMDCRSGDSRAQIKGLCREICSFLQRNTSRMKQMDGKMYELARNPKQTAQSEARCDRPSPAGSHFSFSLAITHRWTVCSGCLPNGVVVGRKCWTQRSVTIKTRRGCCWP